MKRIKRSLRSCLAVVAATVAVSALGATVAAAGYTGPQHLDSDQFAIDSFSTGTSTDVAGARLDFRNIFETRQDKELGIPYGRAKRLEFTLPNGLTGDPTAVPTCPREVFFRYFEEEGCPQASQIGISTVLAVNVGDSFINKPVYNLEPGPHEPAQFGIKFGGPLYAFIKIKVNSDGEIKAVIDENPIGSPVLFSDTTLWGVIDHTPGEENEGDERAFMSNPTNCTERFRTTLLAESFEFRNDLVDFSRAARTDCENVPFAPSMSVKPTGEVAGEPTGLDVDIAVPQSDDPGDRATAHVKDVTMTLPEGLGLSASAATGLGSCSPQEFGYHEETPVACPLNSKIGEVEVETPILEEPLKGPVYVARQNDNPFGSLLALYMAPSGSGVTIKLAGKVDLDPNTGRLTTTFLNNPQQPFSELHVRLKDGPHAPLALPRACGTYTTTADLRSWAMPGEAVPLSSSFSVDEGCGRDGAFTPGLKAGTKNPKAGAFAPFTMRITRADDAQANISRLEATLPEGLLAKIAGVPLCSDAAAAAADCPESTKVGHTTVGVGAGPDPVFAPEPGKAPTALYLGGPYNGGPYSLIAEVPAQAGPFDLGTVILKNTLRVNPRTSQVTAISDPLPQILQGVPISYRDIRVDVDRPNFTLNPTDCEAMSVAGTIGSIAGQAAQVADRFQARECKALGFKPKLALRLEGGTGRGDYPALTAVLKARPGDANIGRVSVALPHSAFLAQSHIRTVCTRVQFAADACPKGSIYGQAEATTPLLDQPLKGPVYLRSSDNPLPDLVMVLGGQIEIELGGRIDSHRGGIRNTFDLVPDAPVTRFRLRMQGGKKGLVELSRDICQAGAGKAIVEMDGQNGRSNDFRLGLGTSCGKKRN